jgi:probable rRNA maturation factor
VNVDLELQIALDVPGLPDAGEFRRWTQAALLGAGCGKAAELVIRIVDEAEMTVLNETYRHKQGPTNVLSFPFEPPLAANSNVLGDVVICAPIVVAEAVARGKPLPAHWAHLVIHGVLHLLGHDHQEADNAQRMEALEAEILANLGHPDPYGEEKKV